MTLEIKRSDEYIDYTASAPDNKGYINIDTSNWVESPWLFYELPALKFEIFTSSDGELVKYKNFEMEIRTYTPVHISIGSCETISITDVPESFTLRITPMFDNESITARNTLIENGIETGEIWGKDQCIPTQEFSLNIEFIGFSVE